MAGGKKGEGKINGFRRIPAGSGQPAGATTGEYSQPSAGIVASASRTTPARPPQRPRRGRAGVIGAAEPGLTAVNEDFMDSSGLRGARGWPTKDQARAG